ncbi:glucose-6-phosphate dehydrogenase [Camelimonas abortus]|uniref:Glucose-6-phosphate 1-dehydrogenase n=1 Tax=Camelimonas abortus TaxID=1017184 RepID=A0ABV7LGA9_9HYPH
MSAYDHGEHPQPDPCCFVIFGASGDLTQRLLTPALYNLAATDLLPDSFALVGVARGEETDEGFRNFLEKALREFATRPLTRKTIARLLRNVSYVRADPGQEGSFGRLKAHLEKVDATVGCGGNRIFYLATPPAGFVPIVTALGEAGMVRQDRRSWRRVIVEKPFGHDLESARRLNAALLEILEEEQIFRMDHYLGKETVQNIMMLRFANGLFEPVWNRNHIDHVQITVAETVDVGRRGRFYDATGALRDMVPNHLFQLLSLIAMEPPSRFDANAVRAAKAAVLQAIGQYTPAEALRNSVRAAYDAGVVRGQKVGAYRDAPDVAPDSHTETYVAMKLMIDTWRWAGVPFYLRTGKALGVRKSEVAIRFKEAPISMFRNTPVDRLAQNFLVLGIQPDEHIKLHFNVKAPGPELEIRGVDMTFRYSDFFDAAPSTGYETLIYDCMTGDGMLFQRADAVEAGWAAVDPFLRAWARENEKNGARDLASYPAGTDGPEEANRLIERDGRSWRPLT